MAKRRKRKLISNLYFMGGGGSKPRPVNELFLDDTSKQITRNQRKTVREKKDAYKRAQQYLNLAIAELENETDKMKRENLKNRIERLRLYLSESSDDDIDGFQPKNEISPSGDAPIIAREGERKATPKTEVPLPTEKLSEIEANVLYASRDGQAQFRDAILEAYGRCAMTGCIDEATLQAAHIIPYVNRSSNIVRNGLCLRADIHCLYDRNLILIDREFKVCVSGGIISEEYRALDGRKLKLPRVEAFWPNRDLLAIRHRYV